MPLAKPLLPRMARGMPRSTSTTAGTMKKKNRAMNPTAIIAHPVTSMTKPLDRRCVSGVAGSIVGTLGPSLPAFVVMRGVEANHVPE